MTADPSTDPSTGTGTGTAGTVPDVSVIIGAYNAMPYLPRCLDSVLGQTLGTDRMEILAVNDGSTDDTGTELDQRAAIYPDLVRVVHQENSGGPAGPRNTGLDLARGRYVFFLDADDYLGSEALERMVATADAERSDVVLGRMEGVGGRKAPTLAFKEHRTRATVFDSRVYWNLTVLKLFRRELIERLGLRFLPELRIRQDQPFCAMAYLHAANISVLTDYTFVYWVFRDDGDNISRLVRGTEYRIRALEVMFRLLTGEVPDGPRRDQLLYRHLATELRATLRHLQEEELSEETRREHFGELQRLLITWHHPGAVDRLPAIRRLHYELVRHGFMAQLFAARTYTLEQLASNGDGQLSPGQSLLPDEVLVEDGRAYARYPYFRDARVEVPESVFDYTAELRADHYLESVRIGDVGELRITGRAGLPRVLRGEPEIAAVLRERGGAREYLATTTTHRGPEHTPQSAGFTLIFDPASVDDGGPLPAGIWDLWLEIRTGGLRHRVRAGNRRATEVPAGPVVALAGRSAGDGESQVEDQPYAVYFTNPYGNLSLDSAGSKHAPLDDLTVETVAWAPTGPPRLRVTGAARYRYPAKEPHLTAWLRGSDGDGQRVPLPLTDGTGTFQAELILPPIPGDWLLSLDFGAGHSRPLRAPRAPVTAKWYRAGWPWYAKPFQLGPELGFRVGRVRPVRALLSRLRRLAGGVRRRLWELSGRVSGG